MSMPQDRFKPERLIATACEEAGSDDFGADGWQDGLQRVTDALIHEARLSAIGVEIAHLDLMRALRNRLGVIAWRRQHRNRHQGNRSAHRHRRPAPHRNDDSL